MATTKEFTSASTTIRARKAALAAFVGGVIEYYDFFIYGSAAALVFPLIFFTGDTTSGILLSFATFAVAYVARPLGAVILGHIGDRYGRRRTLVLIIAVMGFATFLIGCLPTYHQIGILAPILLVLLRVLQGLSVGGEKAGAGALALESSPADRRGFYSSFVEVGCLVGILLGNLVMFLVAMMPNGQFESWGWRIPFLLTIVMMAFGLIVRHRLEEPEVFAALAERDEVAKIPLVPLLRDHWRAMLRVFFTTFVQAPFNWFSVFGLSFATLYMGVPSSEMLSILLTCYGVQLVGYLFAGRISDSIGRRPVIVATAFGTSIGIFVVFWAISTGDVGLMYVAAVLLALLNWGGSATPAYFGEMFSAKVRFSGIGIANQLASLVIGFTPLIGAALLAGDPGNWYLVALVASGMAVCAGIAAMTGPETSRLALEKLGEKPIA